MTCLLWNGVTTLDLPPERILSAAIGENMKAVVIVGETEGGAEYLASSVGERSAVWMLERAKKALLAMSDDD